jgi:DNA adenine methylase
VLLLKDRVNTEVYNDLDGDAVNLFRVIREKPAELCLALSLTPYAREEYQGLYEPTDNPVERARRLVARSFMGMHSKGAMERSGFDARINDDGFVARLRSLTAVPEELAAVAGRMTHVIIENCDALALIDRYDRADALFYFDPPYLDETRSGAYYTHEFSRRQHQKLLEALPKMTGLVVLSGYPSPLYDDALQGWARVERDAFTDNTGSAHRRTEVLWINPAAFASLGRPVQQLSLGGLS